MEFEKCPRCDHELHEPFDGGVFDEEYVQANGMDEKMVGRCHSCMYDDELDTPPAGD